MRPSNCLTVLTAFVLLAVTSCGGQATWTVPDAIQNGERLDGKTLRLRGWAYLWVDPSQAEMWGAGGCMPATDPVYRPGVAEGWLTLYDSAFPDTWGGDHAPRQETGVSIAESAFRCRGDYCKITCSSFEVVSGRMYEFAGRLKIREDSTFILEDIDLAQSRQQVDGTWLPLSPGDFQVSFP